MSKVLESSSSSSSDDVPISVIKARMAAAAEARAPPTAAAASQPRAPKPTAAKPEAASSSSSSSDDEPLSAKLAKAKATASKKAKAAPPAKPKKEKKAAADELPVHKWWLEEPLPEGKKWRSLAHNGVLFAPPYEPHGVRMRYDGEPVELPADAEELATFYSMYLESAHVKKAVFNKNFFSAFKAMLPKGHVIKRFELCDFKPIRAHLLAEKERKKNRSKAEKDQEKEDKAAQKAKYGFSMVDGHKTPIANYMVEPPGLFLGRGDHPKTGCVKKRIMPEDVTINIGKGETVPPCPVPGHKWGKVIHDDSVTWLANWTESINNNSKYVWLSASSRVKGEADRAKYNKARELARKAPAIRRSYTKELHAEGEAERQRATALWMIDVLALRVGNEKGEDEAETYGACSLLVEHVTLTPPSTLKLSFLGKDSMPYENEIEAPAQVWANISTFVANKSPKSELFDKLTTSALNAHLKSYMSGLTAKCFRTFNASYTLEQELAKAKVPDDAAVEEKLLIYNAANRAVSVLCNHMRTVPKTFDESTKKMEDKIKHVKSELKFLKACQAHLKTGEGEPPKPPAPAKEGGKPISMPKDAASAAKRVATHKSRIAKLEADLKMREDSKTIALGTAKLNYMDPRITAAWCKKVDLPIEKVFAKTLRQKFPWALDVEPTWRFYDGTEEPINEPSAAASSGGGKKKSSATKRKASSSSTASTSTKKRRASTSRKARVIERDDDDDDEESDEELSLADDDDDEGGAVDEDDDESF